MALNLPVFYQRTASAIVFGIIMIAGLFWNEWSFLALVCLINVLCLNDYFKLMQKIDAAAYWPAWLPVFFQALSIVIFIPFAVKRFPTGFYEKIDLDIIYSLLAVLFLIAPAILLMVSVLFKRVALSALQQATGGLFYITLPMLLLYMMRFNGVVFPAALIFMIWSNDTLAYLVGSFIGKTPFSPISPKKTWEGTGGGAILTIIAACAYGYCSHQYRITDWIALALCATVAGTLGDLVESKLKRLANVKDSGAIMPGHGGALDRFDSLLVAAPFAAAYVLVFMKP